MLLLLPRKGLAHGWQGRSVPQGAPGPADVPEPCGPCTQITLCQSPAFPRTQPHTQGMDPEQGQFPALLPAHGAAPASCLSPHPRASPVPPPL